MNKKTYITLMIVLFSQLASAEIVCQCFKIWGGGPVSDYRGDIVNAGTVTGANYEDALDNCRFFKYPGSIYYNADLRSCTRL